MSLRMNIWAFLFSTFLSSATVVAQDLPTKGNLFRLSLYYTFASQMYFVILFYN